ncbi:MAG: tetratricopeptide (TPR) repeat protein [Planctomycetota bacterium]|jgi:tetratricopeptide (TPR) repeat protein
MRTKLLLIVLAGFLAISCTTSEESTELRYGNVEDEGDYEFKGDAADYFSNAQEYYGAGDYGRAMDQFYKLVQASPEHRPGRLGLSYSQYYVGLNMAYRGRLNEASRMVTKSEEGFKSLWNGKLGGDTTIEDDFNWKACLGLAMSERAIASLEKMSIDLIDSRLTGIKDTAKRNDALSRQATHSERRSHYLRESFNKLENLARMDNAAPEVLLNLGDIYLIRGNEVAAERSYLQYLEIARTSVETWNQRRLDAHKNFKTKKELTQALGTMKSKEESATKKTVDVLVHLAEIKFSRKNWGDSLSYLKDAMDLDPERQALHVPMAECYDKLKNYDQALTHINQFIQSSPSFSKNTQKAFRLRSQLIQKRGDKTNG